MYILSKREKKEYQKEISRIKRQIKRLEKRGYDTSKVKIPKTLQGAKNLTLDKIYEKSTKDGIKGNVARERERSKSAKKAAQTRRRKRQIEKERRKKERQQEEQPYYPNLADIILDNLIILIQRLEEADVSWGINKKGTVVERSPRLQAESDAARQSLLDVLYAEIDKVGKETVALRVEQSANSGDLTALVETMLHAYDSTEEVAMRAIQGSYQKLVEIIKGGNISIDDMMLWSEIDSDNESYFVD